MRASHSAQHQPERTYTTFSGLNGANSALQVHDGEAGRSRCTTGTLEMTRAKTALVKYQHSFYEYGDKCSRLADAIQTQRTRSCMSCISDHTVQFATFLGKYPTLLSNIMLG
ncbi:hypothetical protein GDO78_000496 [Eleutherodactylus coqui]|uniref:Uncharacterized protein n=1 Tax=Eleutherodactylus coqui TaxID=57060 RepID=A0A8J6FQS8_ELECQ|nr:hypothetical protein GDO78_000496 [Eleutherodactylus coqui]